MKNGVPFDVAATWSQGRRQAALIVLGELNGGKFDYASWRMEWPD